MNELENIGREMPYTITPEQYQGLRERIRVGTTGRAERRAITSRRGWLAVACAAAVVAVVAGVFFAGRQTLPEARPEAGLDQLIRTASDQTLQQAAAKNYDDILFNQQL